MDLRKLKTILELFEESNVVELELQEGEDRVRLCKNTAIAAPPPPAVSPTTAAPPPPAATMAPEIPKGDTVNSPMVGTFYRASSPESPPFVRVGQTVTVGQTLCIIEAMKLMNEIPSTVAGKITHILAENGDPIGFGDPLFVIE